MAASPAVTKKPITKSVGRPPVRTPELEVLILNELASGRSLRSICQAESLPDINTVLSWIQTDELFRQEYARARDSQTDVLMDEIVDLADEQEGETEPAKIQAARLRIEARLKFSGAVSPKKYGNRPNETHVTSVTNNNLILLDESRLKELQERRQAQLLETVKKA